MLLKLRILKFSILRFIRKLKKKISIKEKVAEWQLCLFNIDGIIQGYFFDIRDEVSINILYNFMKEFFGSLKTPMDSYETLSVMADYKYLGYGSIGLYDDNLFDLECVEDMKKDFFGTKTGSLVPA